MKRFLIGCLFLFLVACSNEKALEPDSPSNAAILLKQHIDNGDYEGFKQRFFDGLGEKITRSTFHEFGELTTSGSNFRTFELMTFDNGEMLLVEVAIDLEEEIYKIINVTHVPEEMKEFFSVGE